MLRVRQFKSIFRVINPGVLRRVPTGRYASTTRRRKTEDDDGDFRPPWVYSTSRFLTYTGIPVALLYCVFIADWGEREHVFMPPRRWVSQYVQSLLSISPEEAALARGSSNSAPSPPDNAGTPTSTDTDSSRNDAERTSSASSTGLSTIIRSRKIILEAEIYAIKRQYLGLLPSQQVIDICLTFEAHAPLHLKSSVWPYDIRAAIASIQTQKAQTSQSQTQSTTSESDPSPKTAGPQAEDSSTDRTPQPQAGTSQNAALAPSPAGSSTSTTAASPSHIPPTTPVSHYPHQPYYHPTYQHAPYYGPPHSAYPYQHPYASYPQPPPPYPVNPTTHPPPLFTNAPLVHPPHSGPEQHPPGPPLSNVDDLPSYEEMIVEALLDSGDSEGCAPKSLFSWMAMHYPLQTNFRPSASQALQKAYRRGRLEKGSNGKYRLNENWEGGNTSRRTTRRPQTLAQTTLPGQQPSSSSPFTHAPLVPHGATSLQPRVPPPGEPPGYGGYPYPYSYQGTSRPAPALAPGVSLEAASQRQGAEDVDREIGEGSDAWEAAQNILKAINFGGLIQMPNDEDMIGEPSTSASSNPPNQPAMAAPDGQLSASGPGERTGSRLDGVNQPVELNAEQRAALQAQLALLAAQLAELADVSEDELSRDLEVSRRAGAPQDGSGTGEDNDDDDDDIDDMVEVLVPMASLMT